MTQDVSDPLVPAVATLFTPRQRAIVYVVSVMLAPAYVVAEANTTLHWGIAATYAAWNGLVGLLAVSNTPTSRP